MMKLQCTTRNYFLVFEDLQNFIEDVYYRSRTKYEGR